MDGVLSTIGLAAYICAAAVATASVVVHARVRWWETEMGLHLMAYMGTLALVLDLGAARLVLDDATWFVILRLVAFLGVLAAMIWRLRLQIKAQRAPRPRPRHPRREAK